MLEPTNGRFPAASGSIASVAKVTVKTGWRLVKIWHLVGVVHRPEPPPVSGAGGLRRVALCRD
jgi:hypothetical protein